MENKKKILIINGNQFGYSAGHYYYCKYLKDTFQIEYICYDRGRPKLELDDVKVNYVHFSPSKIKRIKNFISSIIRINNKIKPDVLFVVYFNFSFLISILCKGNFKILDIRSGSLNQNKIKRYLANSYIKFQSRFFNNCIILSKSLQNLLNIPLNKCLILPLGAEIYYNGEHNQSSLNLLYVGTFDYRRIYETIEGLSLFLQTKPKCEVTYTIIGFGSKSEEDKIVNTIFHLNLKNIVKFEGLKNYNELAVFFEKNNIGVAYVPITPYFQSQPVTKIYEYGLSGLYTLTTNTAENKLLINSKNGILHDDNPKSFSEALESYLGIINTVKTQEIRQSFLSNSWINIVNNQLKPYLLQKAKQN